MVGLAAEDVVIIGGGQAGLCLSYELTRMGIQHLILERGKIGQSWRGRWDSFCLVLPNWTIRLSGHPYSGPEPDSFMPRDDFVKHLCDYADSFHAPVREGVNVTLLERAPTDQFLLRTSAGDTLARQVVVASGGYQKPYSPPGVDQLRKSLLVLDIESYKNPAGLPPGKVLVIGSGQSGCQIAEELHLAGRSVYLSCGRAPWIPRRIGDKDSIAWIVDTPFVKTTLGELPSPEARLIANLQISGRDGGHDLNFRTLQGMGVVLVGHFTGVKDGRMLFARDLTESVTFGDERYAQICDAIEKTASAKGLSAPSLPKPPLFTADPPESVDLAGFGAAIVTSGFRPDYTNWIRFPEAFDGMGYPIQHDGSSTVVTGLHFMGVHYQRTRVSATLLGVAEDAEILARKLSMTRRPA